MKEYILEVKKLIPEHTCKKIISYFDNNYEDAGTSGAGVNKNIRNCLTRSILHNTHSFGEQLVLNYITSIIFGSIDLYKKDKPFLGIKKINQLDILRYDANEFPAGYDFHVDFGTKTAERHLSISICLNNNYEGGEFVFKIKDEDLQFPQNVGDCLIFPSNFMFPHRVNKITKGTRYALIAWVQ